MNIWKIGNVVFLAGIMCLGWRGFVAAQTAAGGAGMAVETPLPKDLDPESLMRLPSVQREDLDEYGKKVYDRFANRDDSTGPIRGPNSIRLYNPLVADHLFTVNQYLRHETGFGNRLTELAILNTAREVSSAYEWSAHEGAAQRAELEQEIIDIVKYRKDLKGMEATKGLGEKETLIIRLARAMFRDKTVSPALFAEGRTLFGDKGLVELVSLMADYAGAGYLLIAFGNQPAPSPNPPLPIP